MTGLKRNPLLSVIIPIFNAELYLEKCLDSIINQTYKNIELVCINDGSTDNSGEILNKYAGGDKRITVYYQENNGLVCARKKGIQLAKGELIAYVDADDWIEPNMYEEMVHFLQDNDADVVTSGCYREYGQTTTVESEAIPAGVYRDEKLKCKLLACMVGHDVFYQQNIKVTLWSKIYKADIIREYQMRVNEHISISEDIAVIYPLLINAECIYVSGKNYYHYLIRPNSMASGLGEKEKHSLLLLENHLEEEFSKKRDIPFLREQLVSIIAFTRLVAVPETLIKYENDWLFPYEGVNKQDRVIIYGTGRYGKKLYAYIRQQGANIVGVCDQNAGGEVLSLSELADTDFDKIIVAILNYSMVSQVVENLITHGIEKEKIACIDINMLQRSDLIDG